MLAVSPSRGHTFLQRYPPSRRLCDGRPRGAGRQPVTSCCALPCRRQVVPNPVCKFQRTLRLPSIHIVHIMFASTL
ncbi:hypothetical protein BST61_g4743 [Cercospora zeina]